MSQEIVYDDVSPADFCKRLNFLRSSKFQPDLVIHGRQDATVVAHQLIMASRFPYLEKQLVKTKNGSVAKLAWSKYPTCVIESIVSFAYTGSILLTISNVLPVLVMAKALQSESLVNSCLRFLIPKLTMENVRTAWKLAEQIEISKLKDACFDCMEANITAFINTPMLKGMKFESFVHLLQRKLNVSEEDKFDTITYWVEADASSKRFNKVSDVLELISQDHLSLGFIVNMFASVTPFNNDANTKELLKEASQWYTSTSR